MPVPNAKPGSALIGSENFFGIQGGKWRSFTASMFSTMLLSSHDLEDQVNALIDTRGTTWAKVANKPTVFPSDWTNVANKPASFPTNIAGVSGLQTALDAKRDKTTAITISEVTSLQAALDSKQTTLKYPTFSGTTDANGVATITFTGITSVGYVDVIDAWASSQMITGAVVAGSVTTTGCKVQVMRSRATLLLSQGPFETVPAGVSISVRVVGT